MSGPYFRIFVCFVVAIFDKVHDVETIIAIHVNYL